MSSRLLDAGTRKPLLEIVEAHLLQPHLAQLIERGFKVRLCTAASTACVGLTGRRLRVVQPVPCYVISIRCATRHYFKHGPLTEVLILSAVARRRCWTETRSRT
jgi:hypothetical protein